MKKVLVCVFLLLPLLADDNSFFAIVNAKSNDVTIIDTKNANKHITIKNENFNYPHRIAYGGGKFGVVSLFNNHIVLIDPQDPQKVVTTINENGGDPGPIFFGGGYFVVSNQGNNLSFFRSDSPQKITTVQLPDKSKIDARSHVAYGAGLFAITNFDYENIVLIDINKPKEQTEVLNGHGIPSDVIFGGGYFAVLYQGSSNHSGRVVLFKPDDIENEIVIEDGRAQRPIGVGYGNGQFLVANYWSNNVTLIDTKNPSNYQISEPSDQMNFPNNATFGDGIFAVECAHEQHTVFIYPNNINNPKFMSDFYASDPSNIAFGGGMFIVLNNETDNISLIPSTGKGIKNISDWKTKKKTAIAFSADTHN
ncbi:YncE family protein [Candidatus Uabimicrobium sp. HlEnr_7]|uniref:YncE family protein n=1 Tax=Candidatus Uabimicrobium helgolandensis TaxID=3095367 RepID=UPI003557EF7F